MLTSVRLASRRLASSGSRLFSAAAGDFPKPLTDFTEEEKMLKDAGE